MGYADRDYHRTGPPVTSRFADIPVVKWLLISNVAIFVLGALMRPDPMRATPLETWGVFSIESGLERFQLWRLVTFQFLHANFFHLLVNMWALYVFGPFLERWWRSRPFLWFYLLCGMGGALLYSLLVFVPGVLPDGMVGDYLLGASAGVFGVLVGVAILAPQATIRLLIPPIPMKMRTFALIFLALEVFLLLSNSANAGGSAGHLGGALAGVLLMKVPALRSFLLRLAKPGTGAVIKVSRRPPPESKLKPRSELTRGDSDEVDRILDKISREGLQSLTDQEREFLKRTSGR